MVYVETYLGDTTAKKFRKAVGCWKQLGLFLDSLLNTRDPAFQGQHLNLLAEVPGFGLKYSSTVGLGFVHSKHTSALHSSKYCNLSYTTRVVFCQIISDTASYLLPIQM